LATRRQIERILPHRKPFLFVDSIIHVDTASQTIAGTYAVPADDPVFEGHFPGEPVLPGVFMVEMIGQLGLALQYFVERDTTAVAEDAAPARVRATRILGSLFLAPVVPGDRATILARGLASDGIFAAALGQLLVGDRVCCVSAGEVCFL
jgi:3-hydroxymyristoyl/3-hydroxydecanoyl-(acyl carrier protein) dehydratase